MHALTPFLAVSNTSRSTLGFDCGRFVTDELRSSEAPEAITNGTVTVRFRVPCAFTRTVLVGLSYIDVHDLRLAAHVPEIAEDRARIDMVTWSSTLHYASGASWLSLPMHDPDIQFGQFRTDDDHHWSRPKQETIRRITFARTYSAPPKVAVWLCGAHCVTDTHVKVWASDITSAGFTLHLDTRGSSKLYYAGAVWLAHSAGRTDVRSGMFGTQDASTRHDGKQKKGGVVSWKSPQMARPPRVFVAFNMLDIARGRNVRIRTTTDQITETGMMWNIESWGDTIIHHAGATYVAFHDDKLAGTAPI